MKNQIVNTKTDALVFKIPKEMNERLKFYAEKEERSRAFIIRKLIKKFLEGKNGSTTKP